MPLVSLRPVTTGDTALVLDNHLGAPEVMPVLFATADTAWLQRHDGELTENHPDLLIPGEHIATVTERTRSDGEALHRIAVTTGTPRRAIARRWVDLVDLYALTVGRATAHDPVVWLNVRSRSPEGVFLVLSLPYDRRTEPAAVSFLETHINRDQNRVLSRVLNGPDL